MTDVFISYVREDSKYVEYLKSLLESNGVRVWLDKEQLMPGLRWKDAIRTAIADGTFFVSVHSHGRNAKSTSYVNEELVIAIEELRKRPYGAQWLIPVKIDDSKIEDRPIGGGETLLDLNYCDLTNWRPELLKLFAVLGVNDPVLDFGEPLSNGLPPTVIISHGVMKFHSLPGAPEILQGMELRISGGWCQRLEDGSILASVETVMPIEKFQKINQLHGLSTVLAHTNEKSISTDESNPTEFGNIREFVLPSGTELFDFNSQQQVILPIDLPFRTQFVAAGFLDGFQFNGRFEASVEVTSTVFPFFSKQHGEFSLEFRPVDRLPER